MANKNDSIIAALIARQREEELTQVGLALALGIHQGHLSKVMAGKAPLSNKLKAKIERLLHGTASAPAPLGDLELELIQAVRSSSAFRSLVRAAMQMHKQRGG